MFFDFSKKDLLRRMEAAQHASSEIYLDEVYCGIGIGPNNTCTITLSCECSDPNLTGFGGDELYKILHKDKFINDSVAYGYITERVFFASHKFKNTIFLHFNKKEKLPYYFQYPMKDWKIHPCHTCKNGSKVDPYMLIYGGPLPAEDCADSCIKQR